MIIDTHAHIDFDEYSQKFDEMMLHAKENNVEKIIIPAVEPSTFQRVLLTAEKYDNLYCAMGVHPSEAKTYNDDVEQKIIEYSSNPKVIAIGECGLDYYWDKSFNDIQKDVFIKQIHIANKLNKTLIVHDREAHQDTLTILKENISSSTPVVMHCFSGSYEFGMECIKQGYFLAFGGVSTFKNAKKAHEVIEKMPLEYLLLETDSPYLTPEPFRGKENQPAYLKYVVEKIAQLRNITPEEVEKITTDNAMRAFNFS